MFLDSWSDIGLIIYLLFVLIIVLYLFFAGAGSLELEESGLDKKFKPMSKAPEEPIFDYGIIHGLTEGLRGADGGRGGCTADRVVHRDGCTHSRVTGMGDHTPLGQRFMSRLTRVVVALAVGSLGNPPRWKRAPASD